MRKEIINFLVRLALAEDVGGGDITTRAIVPKKQFAQARITAKERGVIAGLEAAREVFRQLDPKIRFLPRVSDGVAVAAGKVIAELHGPAAGILTGERVALNFLQHLSGIATLTHKFKAQISKLKSKVKLLDTRKTIPGLRVLEKYAVKAGGGVNHRRGLFDAILIKDNHIRLAGGIAKAIEKIRGRRLRGREIEVEAKTIADVKSAIAAGADRILLDNMNVRALAEAVKLCRRAKIKTEASGGVTLKNFRAIAASGVDYISVGALTHSAPALDINLKIV